MGQQIPISTSFNLPDGRNVTLETGKLATLADGSALVRMGNTMLLATVVSAKEMKEGQDFFPLSVDYQEKFAAAGRIPAIFFAERQNCLIMKCLSLVWWIELFARFSPMST